MKLGSMKEVLLSNARDIFLFDGQVIGWDSETLRAYRSVLSSFVDFAGNILVKGLRPDHVRLYMANLSEGPSEGEEHNSVVLNHYAIIDEWIRWLYAQEFVTKRSDSINPPLLSDLFSLRSTRIRTYCA
jgi:hypothetical protein